MEIQNRAGESRILLVEDDKEIREGIEIFLRGQGYRVFQAADGVEGLDAEDGRSDNGHQAQGAL